MHQLVNKQNFDNIKIQGTNVKITVKVRFKHREYKQHTPQTHSVLNNNTVFQIISETMTLVI